MKEKASPFDNGTHYKQALKQGKIFAKALTRDSGYVDRSTNFIALASMIVGWTSSRPWFIAYERYLEKRFPRDDIYLHADDFALQVAVDAISGIRGKKSKFKAA